MSKWAWRVIFTDGYSIKNDYLNNVEITIGTMAPLDQLQPAVATVSFLNRPFTRTVENGVTNTQYFDAEYLLGKGVLIQVDPDDDTVKSVFFGRIISYTQTPLSIDGTDVQIEFTAQAFLDAFDQIPYGGQGLPAETEFERVTASADLQNYPTWQEIPSLVTWATLPDYWGGDRQWQQLWWADSSFRPDLIVANPSPDTSLALEAYTGGETTLLQYFISQAMGCGSWIGEYVAPSPDKATFRYYSRVNVLSATPSTVDISPAALTYSLTDSGNLWDVYTEVNVANSTLSASDWNLDTTGSYGTRRLDLVSPAANLNDLQTIATTKVAALSRPLPGLTTVTMDYNSLPAAQRIWTIPQPLLRLLTGIPAAFGGDDYYYIRGLTIRGTKEQTNVDWVLLNKKVLAPGPMWRDVNATADWNSLSTTWTDWNS